MLRSSISALYSGLNCVNTRFLGRRLSDFCVNLTCKKFVFLPFKSYSTAFSKTYYSVLGLKPDATDEEIKNAYYSLSKKYHPDLNVGNKNAESKILEVNEAFEVLGNKVKKEKYDDKMFPKVWEKNSFIYDQEVDEPEIPNYTYRRVLKYDPNKSDRYYKHLKGVEKRKNRYRKQVDIYNKCHSSKKVCKIFF